MATPYSKIYDRFLSSITDYDLAYLPNDDMENVVHGWLLRAIADFYNCKVDLDDRDDEIRCFNVDLSNWEIDVLAKFMVAAWLNDQIASVNLTLQMFGGKEEKYYSQAQHLSSLVALRDSIRTEARKMSRDRSYIKNSYFED